MKFANVKIMMTSAWLAIWSAIGLVGASAQQAANPHTHRCGDNPIELIAYESETPGLFDQSLTFRDNGWFQIRAEVYGFRAEWMALLWDEPNHTWKPISHYEARSNYRSRQWDVEVTNDISVVRIQVLNARQMNCADCRLWITLNSTSCEGFVH